jgi:drug/metabolite transporter (DMT)-like permease
VTLALALLAVFSNALNVVTQHVASTAAPAKDKGWRLALYLIRNPLWLLGVGAMVGAFVFQALALYDGRLSVVQSILVTQLVFSLVIGRLWLRRTVSAAAWLSASVTSAGLALFLIMSEPQGGHPTPTAAAWVPVLATTGGLVALFTVLAARGSPVRRAALYAAASGIVWATMATFIKSATDVLATDGPVVMLERGAVYGLIVAGIVGTVLTQAALHHGPLGVSQPIMVSVDPFVSVVLGVWLYGEHFTRSPLPVTLGLLGFAVMVVGVVFLGRTAPSFEAQAPRSSPAAA